MTTIDVQVTASADDADEQSNGLVAISSTTLLNVDATNEWNGVRFTGITIPAGATINAAYLTLHFPTASLDEPDLTIYGEDTAVPAPYTETGNPNFNISSRTRTTARVDWGSADLGAPGTFNSPSLTGIVQELVDSYDYSGGGVMAFLWTSRANDTNRDTSITSYDGSPANAPRLHIEYTAVAGALFGAELLFPGADIYLQSF